MKYLLLLLLIEMNSHTFHVYSYEWERLHCSTPHDLLVDTWLHIDRFGSSSLDLFEQDAFSFPWHPGYPWILLLPGLAKEFNRQRWTKESWTRSTKRTPGREAYLHPQCCSAVRMRWNRWNLPKSWTSLVKNNYTRHFPRVGITWYNHGIICSWMRMVCYGHIIIIRWSQDSGRQLPPPKSTHWEGCCSLGAVWSKPHPIPRMQQESDQQIMKQPFMKTCCGLLCVEKFSHAPPWMVETL